ncbi:unnamed protein product [Linum trigynum]|uniref:Uncharacterized protein n=1 Tax=Linum trigynum TaxID=586398 RepID=A0AAV2G765_9ROSI
MSFPPPPAKRPPSGCETHRVPARPSSLPWLTSPVVDPQTITKPPARRALQARKPVPNRPSGGRGKTSQLLPSPSFLSQAANPPPVVSISGDARGRSPPNASVLSSHAAPQPYSFATGAFDGAGQAPFSIASSDFSPGEAAGDWRARSLWRQGGQPPTGLTYGALSSESSLSDLGFLRNRQLATRPRLDPSPLMHL